MTKYRTPSGVPIPDNFNDGSAVPPGNWEDPAFIRSITRPGVVRRIDAAVEHGEITADQARGLVVSLRLMRRHLNNERSLPGETLGRDDLPYLAMPFAPREPECAPMGSPKYKVMREAVERIDADRITDGLIATMAENDPPDVRAATQARESAPASLRESIEASVAALGN